MLILDAAHANANTNIELFEDRDYSMEGHYESPSGDTLSVCVYTSYGPGENDEARQELGCEIGTINLESITNEEYTYLYKMNEGYYFFLPGYYLISY